MSIEHKGEMIKPVKPKGKMIKNEQKGEMILPEKKKGNPLWKDTKLNEEKEKKQKINE